MEAATEVNIAADPKVAELVALGAAVGSNCEACFRSHYESAREVGLSTDELVKAVSVAQAVKETPAQRMLDLAARKLEVPVSTFAGATEAPGTEIPVADSAVEPECC